MSEDVVGECRCEECNELMKVYMDGFKEYYNPFTNSTDYFYYVRCPKCGKNFKCRIDQITNVNNNEKSK